MHKYTSDHADAYKNIKINEIKQLVKITAMSPRAIVHKVLTGAEEKEILAVGKLFNLNKILRNYRRSLTNLKPYFFTSLKLIYLLSYIKRNCFFYCY